MAYSKLPLDENNELIRNDFEILSPRNLIETSFPKMGKTLTKANVPKILVGDCEKGTDQFKMRNKVNMLTWDSDKYDEFVKIKRGYIPAGIFETVDELSTANRMDEYFKLMERFDLARTYEDKKKIFEDQLAHFKGMPFPIFCVDTISSVQSLNNDAALYEYNLDKKEDKKREDISKVDEYNGSKYKRNQFRVIKDFIENNAAPCIIWSGHVAERKKIFKKGDDEISASDIALEGLVSTTFTSKADAVAIFYRNEKGCFLDFKKKDEGDTGGRAFHLSNKIVKIADPLKDGERYPKTYWESIYPEIDFK